MYRNIYGWLRVAFACVLISVGTQIRAQSAMAQTQTDQSNAQMLVFQLRAAFGLTPSMVSVLQSKPGSQTSQQAGELLKGIEWGDSLIRVLPFAAPLDVRLVGKNIAALIQILSLKTDAENVNLIVQGQVWAKMPDNSVSFKTSIQTLALPFGSRLYFYPLGIDPKAGAPIAVEIKVDRQPEK